MQRTERVFLALCELFPDADLFTLIHRRGTVSPTIEKLRITTSFVQRLPFSATRPPRIVTFAPPWTTRPTELFSSTTSSSSDAIVTTTAALFAPVTSTSWSVPPFIVMPTPGAAFTSTFAT